LTGPIATFFAQHGSWVRVSIDGYDAKSYAAYRGVSENEFNVVMDNITEFAHKCTKCLLGVSLIVDQKNASHIYNFLSQLKACGVKTVKVSPCIVSNSGFENNQYHKSIFQDVKEQIQHAQTSLVTDAFEIYDAYHVLDEKFDKEYAWCPYLQILPVIGADLNVYSCQDKAYNLDCGLLGSIKEQSFKEFWLSDKNKFFNINPSVHCNHHCVANKKNQEVINYLNANTEHLAFV